MSSKVCPLVNLKLQPYSVCYKSSSLSPANKATISKPVEIEAIATGLKTTSKETIPTTNPTEVPMYPETENFAFIAKL
jgi:hypothetical protein